MSKEFKVGDFVYAHFIGFHEVLAIDPKPPNKHQSHMVTVKRVLTAKGKHDSRVYRCDIYWLKHIDWAELRQNHRANLDEVLKRQEGIEAFVRSRLMIVDERTSRIG